MMQEYIVHEEEIGDLTIKIIQDYDPMSPDDHDTGLFLVHYHDDFWIDGPKGIVNKEDLRDWYRGIHESEDYDPEDGDYRLAELLEEYWIFPVAAYIHSGVSLSLGTGRHFPDYQWDVSHVGAVFASKKEFPAESEGERCAEGLIQEWNDYLSGNVWGFTISRKSKCECCGSEDEEVLESCWGFVGDYEYCLSEAKSIADAILENEARSNSPQTVY